jgi:hypothetical protein
MCCPPSGWEGRPSAITREKNREKALAATRRQIAERDRKKLEAAQTSDSVSELSKRATGSDQDSDSMHEVSEKPNQASVNVDRSHRQSFGARCRQKLRKCLP